MRIRPLATDLLGCEKHPSAEELRPEIARLKILVRQHPNNEVYRYTLEQLEDYLADLALSPREEKLLRARFGLEKKPALTSKRRKS